MMQTRTLAAMTHPDGSIQEPWGLVLTILIGVVALALFVLFIAAVVSIVRSKVLTTGGKVVWILIAVSFPLLGSLLWFLWGKNATLQKLPAPQHHQQPEYR
ncbi:MAG: PLD nuclease N-terminal domain-containing protein [Corynebacterium sp.]|nr:PLD nuclease N-terminal domain-containing protein [Corynebacterium sp.]